MFTTAPDSASIFNVIIHQKNIIVTQDGTLPDFSMFMKIKEYFENPLFFYEPSLKLSAMELPQSADTVRLSDITVEIKEIPIRELFSYGNEIPSFMASRAKSVLDWRRTMNFCPSCGKKLYDCDLVSAIECESCKKQYFPRIEPCIIVLVEKGDSILLAKHTNRSQDVYTCLAGFIESGENAESAVKREVKEEVGLNIKNIKYKGSQSWPFPDQLMLAYTAEYDSGEIILQKEEIMDAKWFKKDECPASPNPGSVAYKLIHNLFH